MNISDDDSSNPNPPQKVTFYTKKYQMSYKINLEEAAAFVNQNSQYMMK
jgi:hypothetical protein